MIEASEDERGLVFSVRVIPRASRTQIDGEHDKCLKVKVTSPPVDGKANEGVVALLAKAFGVSRASVVLLSGQSSRTKKFRVEGGTADRLREIAGS